MNRFDARLQLVVQITSLCAWASIYSETQLGERGRHYVAELHLVTLLDDLAVIASSSDTHAARYHNVMSSYRRSEITTNHDELCTA